MAYYCLQTAYAPLGWAALLKDPQHRLEAVRPVIERLGGTIVNGWAERLEVTEVARRATIARAETEPCRPNGYFPSRPDGAAGSVFPI